MTLTVLISTALLIAILAILTVMGRVSLISAYSENERLGLLVRDFHQNLVAYANSNGEDQGAFRELTMQSTAVESALGWDNVVNGVSIGMYMLNNAPLLPLAIQEMRREYSDSWLGEIAAVKSPTPYKRRFFVTSGDDMSAA